MEVTVNGETRSFDEGITLSEIVSNELDEVAEHVAVAVNDEIIPRGRWEEAIVEEHDDIEIVQPIQGGALFGCSS